jgi:methylase of polypeptide subunit release factors
MMLTQVNELSPPVIEGKREALLSLLSMLDDMGYSFVTATPSTHARVIARPTRQRAESVRDVLGWSLPFARDLLPSALLDRLRAADVVEEQGSLLRATIRVSSVRGTLFVHSAYPTEAADSVFLGPDSYRFAELILARMGALPSGAAVLDYGAGAGVGGIVAARNAAGSVLTLADINPKALFLSSINAEHGGVEHRSVEATSPSDVPGNFDLIVTHPPFMIDRGRRAYRDGGDLYGGQLSLEWVLAGVEKLKPGGRLILHTGVSIVTGRDVLYDALRERLPAMGLEIDYRELDPDIFGEELDQQQYAEVERIAAVGLVIRRTGGA